jgi:hypothetical protein
MFLKKVNDLPKNEYNKISDKFSKSETSLFTFQEINIRFWGDQNPILGKSKSCFSEIKFLFEEIDIQFFISIRS